MEQILLVVYTYYNALILSTPFNTGCKGRWGYSTAYNLVSTQLSVTKCLLFIYTLCVFSKGTEYLLFLYTSACMHYCKIIMTLGWQLWRWWLLWCGTWSRNILIWMNGRLCLEQWQMLVCPRSLGMIWHYSNLVLCIYRLYDSYKILIFITFLKKSYRCLIVRKIIEDSGFIWYDGMSESNQIPLFHRNIFSLLQVSVGLVLSNDTN